LCPSPAASAPVANAADSTSAERMYVSFMFVSNGSGLYQ
jgi:hypothetical protein